MGRKQSMQGEVSALIFRERGSLVQHGKVEQVEAGEAGLQNSLSGDSVFHGLPSQRIAAEFKSSSDRYFSSLAGLESPEPPRLFPSSTRRNSPTLAPSC